MHCNPLLVLKMSQDKLKAMFPHASASTLKRNPEFAANLTTTEARQYFNVVEDKPKNKYGNIKVEHGGMKFDSRKELRCWQELELREKAGEISELCRQVPYDLVVEGQKIGRLTLDFTWIEKGQTVVADCKSSATKKETAYRLRKKLFECLYAPLVIREL